MMDAGKISTQLLKVCFAVFSFKNDNKNRITANVFDFRKTKHVQ